jgi:hypothetical protein
MALQKKQSLQKIEIWFYQVCPNMFAKMLGLRNLGRVNINVIRLVLKLEFDQKI